MQTTGRSAQSGGVLFVSRGQLAGIVLGIFFGLLMILLIVTAVLALLSLVSLLLLGNPILHLQSASSF